jgi:hypothetical protein
VAALRGCLAPGLGDRPGAPPGGRVSWKVHVLEYLRAVASDFEYQVLGVDQKFRFRPLIFLLRRNGVLPRLCRSSHRVTMYRPGAGLEGSFRRELTRRERVTGSRS